MKTSLIAVILLALLTSCTTSYVVTSVNTPLLTNKYEAQVGVNYKVSEIFVLTLEPAAAFAVTDHIGIMYSGSYAFKNTARIDPGSLYYKRQFSEFGAGYFDRFSPNWQYEIYGGYGRGRIDDQYKDDNDDLIRSNHSKYNRYFAQPTIAYVNPVVNIAFTARVVRVQYLESEFDAENFTALEPVISCEIGNKLVFQTQAGISYYLNNFKGTYNPIIISIGLKYRFNRD